MRLRKILRDGSILRTRASHGSGEIADPGLWKRIWSQQLGLRSETEFWRALETGTPVARGNDSIEPPTGPSVPAWIVAGLLGAGVSESEIRTLDAGDAERRLRQLWSSP